MKRLTRAVFSACTILSAFFATQCSGAEKDPASPVAGRIFFLDVRGGRVVSANPDGSDIKILVDGRRKIPDGIAVDIPAGHLYWTNMGKPKEEDGSVERSDLDGSNLTTVVPTGGAFTPKQLKLDKKHGKLYWSDREGMRVMRSNLDGSNIETLVETGQGDAARLDPRNWCVGIAVDLEGGKVYWTRRAATTPAPAVSGAPISSFPGAKIRLTAPISRSCSTVCRSRSIWISTRRIT